MRNLYITAREIWYKGICLILQNLQKVRSCAARKRSAQTYRTVEHANYVYHRADAAENLYHPFNPFYDDLVLCTVLYTVERPIHYSYIL